MTPRQPAALSLSTALPAALLLLVLAPYLRAGFVLDDFLHLERVVRATGSAPLTFAINSRELGLRLWWLPAGVEVHFFRPLALLLLRCEALLFGLHPLPFHLVSLVLHGANVLLVRAIGRRVGLDARMASLAAIGWAVSVHTVAAAGWVSGQSELLAALFVLLSMYCFLRARESGERLWSAASVVILGLGLFTRETAIAGPLLLLAVWRGSMHALPAVETRSNRVPTVAWIAALIVAAYLAFRLAHLAAPPRPYFDPVHSPADVVRLAAKFLRYLAGAAIGVPVLPLVLDGARSIVVIAVMGAAAFVALARLSKRRLPWELAWFAAALVPYAPVMPTSLYMYLPVCGIYWLLAGAMQRGAMVARAWFIILFVCGSAGHLLAANFLHGLSRSIDHTKSALLHAARDGYDDIVIVDAPWWFYCAPSAARLEEPRFRSRVHIVNIAPGLRVQGGKVEWLAPNQFKVERRDGCFGSPLQRFFLFNAEPCRIAPAPEALVVTCDGGSPAALNVALPDSAGARWVVLGSDGREVRH